MSLFGLKRKIFRPLGKKIRKVQKVGAKLGKGLDTVGRKVVNTTRRVKGALEAVKPFVEGVPILGTAVTVADDVAKVVGAGAKASRRAGRKLEKISKRDIAKELEDKVTSEIQNFQ